MYAYLVLWSQTSNNQVFLYYKKEGTYPPKRLNCTVILVPMAGSMTASSWAAKTFRGFLWKSKTDMNPPSQQAFNLWRATSRSSSKVRSNLGWNKGFFINSRNSFLISWLSWSKICFIFLTSNAGTAVEPQDVLKFSAGSLLLASAGSVLGACLVDK